MLSVSGYCFLFPDLVLIHIYLSFGIWQPSGIRSSFTFCKNKIWYMMQLYWYVRMPHMILYGYGMVATIPYHVSYVLFLFRALFSFFLGAFDRSVPRNTRQPSLTNVCARTRTIPFAISRGVERRLVVPLWTNQGCMSTTSPAFPQIWCSIISLW